MDRKRKYDGESAASNKVNRTNAHPDAATGAHLVAQHYNERPDVGVEKRKQSKIIRMRSFNNWIKSVLINRHVRARQNVLDMGCGKGGDLIKWAKARIGHLVAADIAAVSLEQMKDRYKSLRYKTFDAEFHAFDCYSELLAPRLRPHHMFDVVSMQFCLHYAFESEQKARTMLQNVSHNLRSGGWFIGTIPDANWIVKRVRQEPRGSFGFGNSIYRIEFENVKDTDDERKKIGFSRFGCKYMFHLTDAVDCPEYLVHWPTLEKLAAEYGLVLSFRQNFHELYATASREDEFARLLERIGVVGGDAPDMSSEEWEAAGIYLAFAFRKK
ncbi:guanine-N(7)-methyltransferase domain-containing protein [Radiomyces spectabilis]|uniref:guanine-N(7)-methyltransferase domain-containing protein n=1 Tax=Radiomyces spectabilis TaxID=64574 RepID=UPI0022207432|nr:guanine-N(7)-methyltransferase domain-containing protein [Radiomyces spectabilis]KAI8373091.1 guanine-N(7)-methyltransferase domain-containing protein [Radiomyces spectabilis]